MAYIELSDLSAYSGHVSIKNRNRKNIIIDQLQSFTYLWPLSATSFSIFRNGLRNNRLSPRCLLGLHSQASTARHSPVHVGYTPQLTGLKRSDANVSLPNITGHLQKPCDVD